MKIYFYAKSEAVKEVHQQIIKFFKNNGVLILSNLTDHENLADLSFEKMDGLVVEGPEVLASAGYLMALALAQSKPVLYLLPKGSFTPEQLKTFQDNSKMGKFLTVVFYAPKKITAPLADFIRVMETGEFRKETPLVKFTLRFTPRADRYLSWLNKEKKIKKADFLRELIDEHLKNNREYKEELDG